MKHKLALLIGLIVTAPLAAGPYDIYRATPDSAQLYSPFGTADEASFLHPARIFYPETWFHFLNGSVRQDGITQDLEAIAASGIQGIQFFHGKVGDPADWPGTEEHIECLSPKWEALVKHTAQEAHRLGLRFSLQTCPGWATSGGPWIKPEQAMRHLSCVRADIQGGELIDTLLAHPHSEAWRDWRDVAVLAFPTPLNDSPRFCDVVSVQADEHPDEWRQLLINRKGFTLQPTTPDRPHRVSLRLKDGRHARSVVFNPIDKFNHEFGVQPDIHLRITTARQKVVLDSDFPRANWQDNQHTMTFALAPADDDTYILEIVNLHPMNLSSLRFSTAVRGHNWEMEAGWTSRSLLPTIALTEDDACFVRREDVVELTDMMDPQGRLRWKAPQGPWTILRIGHVNTGRRNGPAPAEATGWEVNKFDTAYVSYQFRSYIGRLVDGPLHGLVNNLLLDSWECSSQTWTRYMPQEFRSRRHYDLTSWLPALFGWVLDSREQTGQFLSDWRRTLNDLFCQNFYGTMARLAREKGLTVSYETAAGDIFPADPMEFYKYADVPMTEYWQPFSHWLSNHNYKPIRATASAARMYGKPRVSAESFTSFDLTWDEHLSMLREVANQNMVEGVTHTIFHTYTHNPDADRYFPGTSFGGNIGTPFLRKQTWWPFMRSFNTYLARCAFMLERGRPVSSVLWFLGDEIQQKPDQYAAFPQGFNYDYCNTDALLHRISVENGRWTTPEGITYDVLWLPETRRLTPETRRRLQTLTEAGGRVITDPDAEHLGRHLQRLGLQPDVKPADIRWLHRQIEGADWYMVCPQQEQAFQGTVSFRQTGGAEIWNPMNGRVQTAEARADGAYTDVSLCLQQGEMVFVVFRHDRQQCPFTPPALIASAPLNGPWTLTFPKGWGIEAPLTLSRLQPWKDLPLSLEGKAFSGTATYETEFRLKRKKKASRYVLQLGNVEEIAVVSVNGQIVDTLWAAPYATDITRYVRRGINDLRVQVTSTWFNRLVFDAALPQSQRRTWVIHGPSARQPLRPSGLIGPVSVSEFSTGTSGRRKSP